MNIIYQHLEHEDRRKILKILITSDGKIKFMDERDQKAIDNIKKYGCHIFQVLEEDNLPPFSYSIGVATNFDKPDACVIGLKEPIAKFVINEYVSQLKEGQTFETGNLYSGFLEGFDICVENISHDYYKEYFGGGLGYYKNSNFKMLQIIYPTTSGVYPWSEEVPESFLEYQPILTQNGKTFFHE